MATEATETTGGSLLPWPVHPGGIVHIPLAEFKFLLEILVREEILSVWYEGGEGEYDATIRKAEEFYDQLEIL